MSTLSAHKHTKHYAFTIIELLIVIVVIAILAVISIAAYTNIQNRANDSAVQSDLAQLATTLKIYNAEKGNYPINMTDLKPYGGVKISKNAYDETGIHGNISAGYNGRWNVLYCLDSTSRDAFAVIAKSKSGQTFQLKDGSVSKYTAGEPRNADDLCSMVGLATDGSSRAWLYSAGAWQSYVGS